MLYMSVNILSINVFGIEIMSTLGSYWGLGQLDAFFMVFVQGYFLLFVALEIGKASRLLPHIKMSPPALLVTSFVLLMVIGAGLLWMPEMTRSGNGLSFKEALFTSVSAVSVTGLNIIDVASILSFKGKLVLMVLIQLGGLNFIAFASIFAMLANPALGTRYKKLAPGQLQLRLLGGVSGFNPRDLPLLLLLLNSPQPYCSSSRGAPSPSRRWETEFSTASSMP